MAQTKYPRPQFYRSQWQNLNGKWDFAFDDLNLGHKERYMDNFDYPLEIEVPFCFQSKASGIFDLTFHDHVWYHKKIKLDKTNHKGRVILHFGACDYLTEVYINSRKVGDHEGGHTSFSFDITDYLLEEIADLAVYVYDPSRSSSLPRGKQYWKLNHESIWYPRTTGIWKTVWLEYVPEIYIKDAYITPLYDDSKIKIDLESNKVFNGKIEISILSEKQLLLKSITNFDGLKESVTMDLSSLEMTKAEYSWTPENPFLFDVNLKLITNNKTIDSVDSYFGMRKVHYDSGKFYLNNKEYFQKLILDQGYYPDSLMTSLSDEDLINDILLSKRMGFNGCRKHQKVEEDRFFYHADKLGYLVWGEMANAYSFSKKYVERITKEWTEAVKQNYNHPSIVAWVPLNESWGIRSVSKNQAQQQHQLDMYRLTKELDKTRLVSSNDGWEQMETDICGIHNYMHGSQDNPKQMDAFVDVLRTKENIIKYPSAYRPIYVKGYEIKDEPIMLTEFGGISFNDTDNGWGYTSVNSKEIFLKEYERLIKAIKASECIVGFCYTQLTDVYQEMNGLLNFDRTPKVDLTSIKRINDLIE